MRRLSHLPLLVEIEPAELLVHDSVEECPYLEGKRARMPLRLPVRTLKPHELDLRLARGDRRHGALFYRPTCPECSACEAIRLSSDFAFSSTHRRTLRRGDRELVMRVGPPRVSDDRVALYEHHRHERGLARANMPPMDAVGYQRFLVDRQCESLEFRFERDGKIIAVAIADVGKDAMSAVYCYYDTRLPKLSLGTYAILKQLEFCKERGIANLYLGLYIQDCSAMAYKARFLPHERRVEGEWKRFEK